ncbi:MAG: hypothetical protein IT177_02860 [Acidobacteria bacterium]|nr:hypothetical protein [Acidobacteriota bacterium]
MAQVVRPGALPGRRLTPADTWAIVPAGALAMEKFKLTEPSALNTAAPVALPRTVAPHRSSTPCRTKPPGVVVSVRLTRLQYGCICQVNVPRTCAVGRGRRQRRGGRQQAEYGARHRALLRRHAGVLTR